MTNTDTRYATAIHEAAHAVVAAALGFMVVSVSVQQHTDGGRRFEGECVVRRSLDTPLVLIGAYCAAGAVAQGLAGLDPELDKMDQHAMVENTRRTHPIDTQAWADLYWRAGAIRAMAIIGTLGHAVRALATILMQRGRVDGAELQRLWQGEALEP